MGFDTLITQCQKMNNIYEKEIEPVLDEDKVLFISTRVKNACLLGFIKVLKAQ